LDFVHKEFVGGTATQATWEETEEVITVVTTAIKVIKYMCKMWIASG
jgi:hypothetical protein